MGKERSRNRISCRVDSLPPEGKELLHEMLLDTRNSYVAIAEELTERGWAISKSAIGRYAVRNNSAARRLKEAAEQTQQLIAAVRADHGIDATEVATAIMMDGLTRRLATAEEEYDEMPLDKVGRLVVAAHRSAVYKKRYAEGRKDACDAVEKIINQRLREEVQGDPELLSRLERIVSNSAREEAAKDD